MDNFLVRPRTAEDIRWALVLSKLIEKYPSDRQGIYSAALIQSRRCFRALAVIEGRRRSETAPARSMLR